MFVLDRDREQHTLMALPRLYSEVCGGVFITIFAHIHTHTHATTTTITTTTTTTTHHHPVTHIHRLFR
jgi:hypothetical protein